MNQFIPYLGFALFLAVPPAILYTRARLNQPVSWWAVICLIALGSWLTLNLSVQFYGKYVCDRVSESNDLLAQCVNDGARNVFALWFGWIPGLLYSVPYLLLPVAFRRRNFSSS